MACSIDQVKTMPKVISERTIMKMETSEAVKAWNLQLRPEALYSEWAYILPFTVMSLIQAVVVHAVYLGTTPCEACKSPQVCRAALAFLELPLGALQAA